MGSEQVESRCEEASGPGFKVDRPAWAHTKQSYDLATLGRLWLLDQVVVSVHILEVPERLSLTVFKWQTRNWEENLGKAFQDKNNKKLHFRRATDMTA